MRLTVPAWLARRVAQQTRRLPKPGAKYVDETLAARTQWGTGIVDRVVADAVARFDPAEHARREDRGTASWDVKLTHPGTDRVRRQRASCGPRRLDRAAGAVRPDLCSGPPTSPRRRHRPAGRPEGQGPRRARHHRASPPEKVGVRPGEGRRPRATDAVGVVEKLGPATIARIKEWVGHHRVTIQPVLDPGRSDAVDTHDPPAWMRELVILRDGHCVFPGCARDARSCDLDHITPYDPNGPPGQTRPHNLACLCRRHHRAKTLGLWRYTRTPDGGYLWNGPYGSTYLVTPRGPTGRADHHRLSGRGASGRILYRGRVRSQKERDEVTLTIASWLLVVAIGGLVGALILVLGHLLF